MTDVAIVGFAQAPNVRATHGTTNGVEMLVPIFREVFDNTGLTKSRHRLLVFGIVGLPCRAGVLVHRGGRRDRRVPADQGVARGDGRRVGAVRGVGEAAHRRGGHRAGVRLRQVVGRPSCAGSWRCRLDPYTVAPLWPDSISIAGLQARAGLDAGLWTERDMAEVAARSRTDALANKYAQVHEPADVASCWRSPTSPIRCARTTARRSPTARRRSSWRRARGPANCASGRRGSPASSTGWTRRTWAPAISPAAVGDRGRDGGGHGRHRRRRVARAVHAPGTVAAQGDWTSANAQINPSGGALTGNPMFAAGLARIGEAASRVMAGEADRALGHATSGPALQQNLVCVMEGRN